MKAVESRRPQGLVLFGAISVGVMIAAIVGMGRLTGSEGRVGEQVAVAPMAVASAPTRVDTGASTLTRVAEDLPSNEDGDAADLAARFVDLVERAGAEGEDELARVEEALVGLGDRGAAPLVARLDRMRPGAPARERVLNVLRRVPGAVAESRLIEEAERGASGATRALAIESLGDRKSARSMAALSHIAERDPTLPEHPLIVVPRDPNDTSTELPDEVVFTPRMQAMAALATTRDPRAASVLTSVLAEGPDESLRMEAARNLGAFTAVSGSIESLAKAAASDRSPYVRLSALHSLENASDRALVPLLESVSAHDSDAGVRALALQLLASLGRPSR